MLLPGYCTECQRMRRVRVSGQELVMSQARAHAPRGICAECVNHVHAPRPGDAPAGAGICACGRYIVFRAGRWVAA